MNHLTLILTLTLTTIHINIPTSLTDRQRQLLEEYIAEGQPPCPPCTYLILSLTLTLPSSYSYSSFRFFPCSLVLQKPKTLQNKPLRLLRTKPLWKKHGRDCKTSSPRKRVQTVVLVRRLVVVKVVQAVVVRVVGGRVVLVVVKMKVLQNLVRVVDNTIIPLSTTQQVANNVSNRVDNHQC